MNVLDSYYLNGKASGELAGVVYEFCDDQEDNGRLIVTLDRAGSPRGVLLTDPRGGDSEGNINWGMCGIVEFEEGEGAYVAQLVTLHPTRANVVRGADVADRGITLGDTLEECFAEGTRLLHDVHGKGA